MRENPMATPMRLSVAERSHPTRWDFLLATLILLAAGALALTLFPRQGMGNTQAVVKLDNQVIATLSLNSQGDEPVFYSVEECPYPLVLECRNGAIRVAESQCPGEDCLHTGWISRPGAQIICLPNRLVISIQGTESLPFDAITG